MGPYEDHSSHVELTGVHARVNSRPAVEQPIPQPTPQQLPLHILADRAWTDLPYTMMRITAARREWEGRPLYWQDRTVQFDCIDLDLTKSTVDGHEPVYTAVYKIDEMRRALTRHPLPDSELRRDFKIHPSLDADELRWSAPGLSELPSLTTQQLAEKLLGKLLIFYARGLH